MSSANEIAEGKGEERMEGRAKGGQGRGGERRGSAEEGRGVIIRVMH